MGNAVSCIFDIKKLLYRNTGAVERDSPTVERDHPTVERDSKTVERGLETYTDGAYRAVWNQVQPVVRIKRKDVRLRHPELEVTHYFEYSHTFLNTPEYSRIFRFVHLPIPILVAPSPLLPSPDSYRGYRNPFSPSRPSPPLAPRPLTPSPLFRCLSELAPLLPFLRVLIRFSFRPDRKKFYLDKKKFYLDKKKFRPDKKKFCPDEIYPKP